jgi:hypothetical protein
MLLTVFMLRTEFVMKRIALGAILAEMIALTGCSVHPLPEDYSRKGTFDIVRAIRCEARQAILDHAPEPLFAPAVLGLEFTFKITENDTGNLSSLEFSRVFSSGSLTLPFNASASKDRSSDRNFKIVESFRQLKNARCGDYVPEGKNLAYPITGSIGLAEVVDTYARLERMTNLAAPAGTDIPTFADSLSFTTTLSTGVTPHLVLTPVRHFRLTDANLGLSAQRVDTHNVTLAIARNNVDDPVEKRAEKMAQPFAARKYNYINPVATNTIQDEARARERVLLELDRQRLLRIYERGLVILP